MELPLGSPRQLRVHVVKSLEFTSTEKTPENFCKRRSPSAIESSKAFWKSLPMFISLACLSLTAAS